MPYLEDTIHRPDETISIRAQFAVCTQQAHVNEEGRFAER